MNKLISLFAFICLLSLISADQLSFEVRDEIVRDDYDPEEEQQDLVEEPLDDIGLYGEDIESSILRPSGEEEEVWSNEPIVVVQEGPVPTVELIPNNEPDSIDVQLSEDGEVIVDSTEPDVVLVDSEEEKEARNESSDDINDGDIPVLVQENEEFNFEATAGFVPTENTTDDGEEEDNVHPEESDETDTGDVPVLENGGDNNQDDGNDVTGVVLPPEEGAIDETDEEDFKTEDSDDIDGGDVPVLAQENGEYGFEPTTGFVPSEEETIDGEEEDFKTEESDDVDTTSDIPVLDLENQNGADNNQDDGSEVTGVVLPPEESVIDGTDEEDFKTEDSDDIDGGDVPFLAQENGEYGFEPTAGFVPSEEATVDGEEEDHVQPEESDETDSGDVPVLENENGGENSQDDGTDVTAGSVPSEDTTDDGEEEDNLKTEDSDDVDDGDVPVLAQENGEYNFEPTPGFVPSEEETVDGEEEDNIQNEDSDGTDTSEVPVLEAENQEDANKDGNQITSVELPPEDGQIDGEEENTNEEDDAKPEQIQTVEVKEDGFLP